ncbi:MAG: peptidylprolyl isomerase, partial [Flavobacteriales bacterium]|nr:peptidylprolyl isomerase [Flavobacteriales bacterium]
LDNEYTVFGEVISGMSIVDKISDQITDGKNRPIENIYITIKALKL